MSGLLTIILTVLTLGGLATLAVIVTRVQARAHTDAWSEQRRALAQAQALEMQMDPRYQAKVENDRRFYLAVQDMELKRTRVEVPQHGVYIIDADPARLTHLAPVLKPLALKAAGDDQGGMPALPGKLNFSQVLTTFQPSIERILLGYLPGEQPALATADGLCHVALAGSTGNGKSVLIRLLIAQLCFAGASVLLLNPHYTRYDLRSREDWTPFEPFLHDDPMRCKEYRVIGEYLRMAAQEVLPARLERYSRSLPVGNPFYIVLDELPAIVKHLPDAPGYMADLLREGRKVGLFLVTAAQDFLVKTIMGEQGGAVRDCFRTAVYVGGDPTTARTLLDVRGTVDDGGLGQGVVMLRCQQVKQAAFARVPYVDNESLYSLLGPSTYVTPVESALRPHGEPTQWDFPERNTGVVEADLPPKEAGEADPVTRVETALRPPAEPTQLTEYERKKYLLTTEEIDQFKAAYRANPNIDKALAAIDKGTHYREAARRVIRAYGLREEA